MKNTSLIIGVIIVIIAAAGGYFFMQSRSGNSLIDVAGKKMAGSGETKMMSLKELMNMGTSQMCTFSYSDDNGSVEGTSYTADGKVRTDFSGNQPEMGAYTGSMIFDSEYMYSWTSNMPQGVKMAVTDALQEDIEEEIESSQQEDYQQQFDPNQEVEYNCSNWNVDNSVFTPPSDITFIDMTQQMEQLQQMMPEDAQTMELEAESSDMKAAQCATCDQAGESAAACRQALGC